MNFKKLLHSKPAWQAIRILSCILLTGALVIGFSRIDFFKNKKVCAQPACVTYESGRVIGGGCCTDSGAGGPFYFWGVGVYCSGYPQWITCNQGGTAYTDRDSNPGDDTNCAVCIGGGWAP